MQQNSPNSEHEEEFGVNEVPKVIGAQDFNEAEQKLSDKDFERVPNNKKQSIVTEDILDIYRNMGQEAENSKGSRKERRPQTKMTKKASSGPQKKPTIYQSQTPENQKLLDQFSSNYKEYLKESRSNSKFLDPKLQLFKLLIIGCFELRKKFNDAEAQKLLTKKERDIAEPKTDIYSWVKKLCDVFEEEFIKAAESVKFFNPLNKWDTLIKGCRNETNFELRRKIITRAIKAKTIIDNPDSFLLSSEARAQFQRQKRLILAEAGKNFDKASEENSEKEESEKVEDNQTHRPVSSTTLPVSQSSPVLKRSQTQQNREAEEKIAEYETFLNEQFVTRMRDRIEEYLQGTQSYGKIMGDFKEKFPVSD